MAEVKKEMTLQFRKRNDTKNKVRFEEVAEGKAPVVETLYIPKWVAGDATTLTLTIKLGS